jgi:hypothetical protein
MKITQSSKEQNLQDYANRKLSIRDPTVFCKLFCRIPFSWRIPQEWQELGAVPAQNHAHRA